MEAVSRNLQAKFDIARLLLDRLVEGGVESTVTRRLQSELAAQEVRYALATGHLYLKAAGGESGRASVKDEFARIVAAENFGGEIDSIVNSATSALMVAHGPTGAAAGKKGAGARKTQSAADKTFSAKETLRSKSCRSVKGADSKTSVTIPVEIQRVLDTYPHCAKISGAEDARRSSKAKTAASSLPSGAPIARIEYEKCADCNAEMIIDPDRSELRCLTCGAVRELDGTVFDDAQFYSQEGQKAKSGTFNPNRHFLFWWTHILAREPEEELGDPNDADNLYGEKLLEHLRTIIRRDQKILRLLTVNDVRAMLREIGRTNLNKNVPLVLKKLTGVGPPSPPDSLGLKVEKLFSKAIEIGERLRSADRTNRNYYPFYIGKILDCILPENDENRRILYYIYLQSDDTVRKDDDEWEAICDEMDDGDGITYKPTDKALGLKYRPD